MQHLRPTRIVALSLIGILLIVWALSADVGTQRQVVVADFAAPLPTAEAGLRVLQAQQSASQQRENLARQLQLTSPEALPQVQTIFIPETRYHLSDRTGFLSYWRTHGGVHIFGYPISEEIVEDGRIVQYFERARFEYHAEFDGTEQQVQLALVGREFTAGRSFEPGVAANGERFFAETGHTLSGPFLRFWEKRGGLERFGYPISEPFWETSPVDGRDYLVQYFERARFEHHPDELWPMYRQNATAYGLNLMALREVQLGDLGRQIAVQRGYNLSGMPQLNGAPGWSASIWPRRIVVDISEQYLTAYEGETVVFRAAIATGRDGFNTPIGEYAIYYRLPMQTMRGTAGGETWDVPNVPWVQYVVGGVALHGTYWHDLWGTGVRMSHGCINLNIDDAQWLYEWAEIGVPVTIQP
jgi:hypothetical protein